MASPIRRLLRCRPSSMAGPKRCTPTTPPDLDRALELMSEAGYEDGFSVDLHCPNDRYLN